MGRKNHRMLPSRTSPNTRSIGLARGQYVGNQSTTKRVACQPLFDGFCFMNTV